MNIYESAEDYLESILIITEKNGYCRSIDISNDLGFSKPSVSVAMKKLKENGYINIEEHGHIVLTKEGKQIAEKIYERHDFFANLFMNLGVDEQTSFEDACQIEHAVSSETFMKLKQYFENHPIQK